MSTTRDAIKADVFLDGLKCVGAVAIGADGASVTMPVHDSAGNVIRYQKFEGAVRVVKCR